MSSHVKVVADVEGDIRAAARDAPRGQMMLRDASGVSWTIFALHACLCSRAFSREHEQGMVTCDRACDFSFHFYLIISIFAALEREL